MGWFGFLERDGSARGNEISNAVTAGEVMSGGTID